ncbi:MAG: chromosome segregation ATPase, partial [Oleiphilaceae bacterium]
EIKTQLGQSNQGKAEQQKLAAESQTELDALKGAREEEAKTSNDHQQQLVQLQEQHKQVNGQLAEVKTQLEQSNQVNAEQQKLAADRQTELAALKAQDDKLNAERAQQQTEKEQLVAQVAALQTKQNEQTESQKNKDVQIAELTKQRDQQAEEQQENKQRAEALKIQNDKLSAASAQQQQTEIEQLTAQVNVFETKRNELVEGHKNKDTQITELTKQRDQQAQEHQTNKQRAERLNQQCEELKVYSGERQKSADLALKLQTKAQIDLENLREKYQHKHINEQKLVALISELRAKLQQAAEYYYELQEKHPELNEITHTQVQPSHTEEYQTANVAELEKKTRPAKRKTRGKQTKSVTRGKS